RQPRASLLLVPYHDHAWDAVHRPDGVRHVAELARKTRVQSLVALGFDAGISLPIHCQHARLDDGRTRTPTLVDLWAFPHGRWLHAKTPEERRQVIAAIGPLWTWHEVWLLGFGGTLIAIFPRLMASSFAGYYLALFLILWCLILRGVSLEVGGHINDRLWQAFWDFIFVCSNFLLAILFGAAAGNVARGVPLNADGNFSMAFFTDFNVRGHVGL